jgi:hypothetical protein
MQQFLRGLLRLNAYRSRRHHQEAAELLADLHRRGVPAAAINGIAHAALLYPAGLRQSSDVDILVPAHSAATAVDVLTARSYVTTGRRPAALHRDFDDPLVPGLTLDLTTRLAHSSDPAEIEQVLARRVHVTGPDPAADALPVLHRGDGFRHTLARCAAQRRWPALADALRYAVDGTAVPPSAPELTAPEQAGWDLLRSCWPQLTEQVPVTAAAR